MLLLLLPKMLQPARNCPGRTGDFKTSRKERPTTSTIIHPRPSYSPGQTNTHHSFENLHVYFQNRCHTHYLLLSRSFADMAPAAITTGADFLKSGPLDGNLRRVISSSETTVVDLDEHMEVASDDEKGKNIDVSINGQSANRPNIIDLDDPQGYHIKQTSTAFDLSPRAVLAQAVDTATFVSMLLYLGKLAGNIPSAAAAGQGWLWPTLFVTAKVCNYCKILTFLLLDRV